SGGSRGPSSARRGTLSFLSFLLGLGLLSGAGACGSSPGAVVEIDVTGDSPYAAGSRLTIQTDRGVSRTFAAVTLAEPVHAQLNLPTSVTGTVAVWAEIDDGVCVHGRSADLSVTGVAPGKVLGPIVLSVAHLPSCDPVRAD